MAEILRFDSVTLSYDEKAVLTNFSCSVDEGEFVTILGPNGAGKSTLINSILGLVPPSSGTVILDGQDNRRYSAKERARIVAVVPQMFSTSFAFTVRDVVMMGRNPYLKRMQSEGEEDLAIVDDALRMTSTFEFKDRKITSLSGGERQRVVISSAIAQTPRLLVLDEPTNQLDLRHTLEVMALIREMNLKKGLTVLAVLHDINMAARYSDRLILINNGVIVKDGKVHEVIDEDVLSPVYKVDMVVRKNRLTDSLEVVSLLGRADADDGQAMRKVHVVCGGGSGEGILAELRNSGYEATSGVLNTSDSDAECCASLGVRYVAERPYSAISDAAHQENVSLISAADAIIITDVPIGSGNLKNLEAVAEALALDDKDRPVYVVDTIGRDYVDGKADAIISWLVEQRGATLTGGQELLRLVGDNRI
jgi:iron complex transport system ATP-binding protein